MAGGAEPEGERGGAWGDPRAAGLEGGAEPRAGGGAEDQEGGADGWGRGPRAARGSLDLG